MFGQARANEPYPRSAIKKRLETVGDLCVHSLIQIELAQSLGRVCMFNSRPEVYTLDLEVRSIDK